MTNNGEKLDHLANYITRETLAKWHSHLPTSMRDEVLSEAYVAAAKSEVKHPNATGNVLPWSWTQGVYAYGCLIQALRKQNILPPRNNPYKKMFKVGEGSDDFAERIPSMQTEGTEQQTINEDLVQYLIAELDDSEKEILDLVFKQGLNLNQVSKRLKKDRNTINKIYKRIIAKLQTRERIMK